jgi:hypothetical protein
MIQPLAVRPSLKTGSKLGLAGFIRFRFISRDSLDDSVFHMRDQKTTPAAVVRTADGNLSHFTHGETP